MYYTYDIYISFRGRHIKATVHQYEDFRFVYYADEPTNEVMKEFGGQLRFDNSCRYLDGALKTEGDAPTLFAAIKGQLKPLDHQ